MNFINAFLSKFPSKILFIKKYSNYFIAMEIKKNNKIQDPVDNSIQNLNKETSGNLTIL